MLESTNKENLTQLTNEESETGLQESADTNNAIMALAAATSDLARALTTINYSPTNWVDNAPPDINAANLNKIEQGILQATTAINSAFNAISAINGNLSQNTDVYTYYNTPQECMDGILNWILNIPEKSMSTKIISCGYEGSSEAFNVSGELYGGVFFLIGFRTSTYAGITAYSYWRARVVSVASIENGVWAKRFEKLITNNDLSVIASPSIRIRIEDDSSQGRRLIITDPIQNKWYGNILMDTKGDGVLP